MFNPYNFNTMPTSTQPYGYPLNPYQMPQQQPQPQQSQQNMPANTNKIFVANIDDVKNRALPFNSDFIFLDNDKPLLYQKTVNSTGQFEIKTFSITPVENANASEQIDLSSYAKTSELEAIKSEIEALKSKIETKSAEVNHGTTNTTTNNGGN